MMGSSERIVAFVGVLNDSGEVKTTKTLPVLSASNDCAAHALVDEAIDSLSAHLKQGHDIERWSSTLANFTASPMQRYAGANDDDVMQQITRLRCFFYRPL